MAGLDEFIASMRDAQALDARSQDEVSKRIAIRSSRTVDKLTVCQIAERHRHHYQQSDATHTSVGAIHQLF